ncbi:hypothetical protein LI221_15250 [Faecalimonas umbilicata]|nr:hypothetical protein [Faecalimonas umbilicata]
MKIYNKKGLLGGVIWVVLALWNIFLNFSSPDPNMAAQIKDSVLSVLLLLIGITSFVRVFSKKAAKEDMDEEHDDRNCLIEYKSKSKMLDITYGVLVVAVICGMIGFKMTTDTVWFFILIISAVLLGLLWIIEIFITLYYEKSTEI